MGQLNYNVTDENLTDILVCAFEGGINYWCGQVIVKDGDYKGANCAASSIAKGSTLILVDAEEIEDDAEINKEKMLKAIEKYINENGTGIVDLDSKELDCGQIDAEVADCIVQLAAFGEVVYG